MATEKAGQDELLIRYQQSVLPFVTLAPPFSSPWIAVQKLVFSEQRGLLHNCDPGSFQNRRAH